ncbi:MAG: MATE family efflux transporter [Oscillospiraceae bacterium]|nr:MATE family efflux transporter [Oscillospiraceae bacterium]
MTDTNKNFLGTAPVKDLMIKFSVPSIIAMMVGALYNIVDQFFIGQKVGFLGNAATNVAFPCSTSCIALALLFGIGGASCFNLHMGKGETEKAPFFIGNSAFMLAMSGLVLAVITETFLPKLLVIFGAPEDVMPYALEYVGITALGFPFLVFTTGGCHLVRADGSPRMSMLCNLTGALINTVLDAVFVMGFEWGMKGAAIATVIGQIVSSCLVIIYLTRFKTVKLDISAFMPRMNVIGMIASIGMASFFNQIAMMIVQIVLNNSLTRYGALSSYGPSVPLACAGIIMKVNMIVFSVVIGLGQGTQPIESFNYGAKNYARVRQAYRMALTVGTTFAVLAFIMFQTFPRQIINLFGEGSPEYFEFGIKFMRTFLFFTWLNSMQPITSTFFTSIGKPIKGVFLSLTRQIIFFLPLLLILPVFFGIDGVIWTGPAADFLSGIVTIVMAILEFKDMKKLEDAENASTLLTEEPA